MQVAGNLTRSATDFAHRTLIADFGSEPFAYFAIEGLALDPLED